MKKLGFELSQSDLEEVKNMTDLFMEKGFTYFDIRDCSNEMIFRKAVAERYPRSSYTIAMHLDDHKESFEKHLKRLGVDYADYCFLSALSDYSFLEKKKKEGKIRHIGLAFSERSDVLDEILMHTEVEYVQLMADEAHTQFLSCYEVSVKHRKPVIAVCKEMKSMEFAVSLAGVMMAVMQMENENQMKDHICHIEEVLYHGKQ